MSSQSTGATGLAGRYARALYDLAESSKLTDAIAADLKSLQQLIDESDDLRRMIRSPIISRSDQMAAMDAVLSAAGAHELLTRFIGVVSSNRRLFALPGMIAAFLGIHTDRRGEVSAEVASAAPLSDGQLDALAKSLSKAVGSDVAINAAVDPDLLGGLVVKVGSRMVDSSLRTKLQHLRLVMKGVG